jgi:hypothetical protein
MEEIEKEHGTDLKDSALLLLGAVSVKLEPAAKQGSLQRHPVGDYGKDLRHEREGGF